MLARGGLFCALRLLIPAVLLFMACSSGAREEDAGGSAREGEDTGDDALVVPEGLAVTALAGGNGVLDVIALTLRRGPNGTELYAALRNDGDIPACSAAFSVELFDKAERSVAAGIGGLLTQHFYRLTDGSDTIAACLGPGDVTMAAVLDLPSDVAIEEVGTIVYRCPYFALDVAPIAGLTIRQVGRVPGGVGTAYAGTLVNGLDVTVKNPSVTIFQLSRVGRPLGMAVGSGTVDIPPGGSWAFETSTLFGSTGELGVDYVAYPAGELAN